VDEARASGKSQGTRFCIPFATCTLNLEYGGVNGRLFASVTQFFVIFATVETSCSNCWKLAEIVTSLCFGVRGIQGKKAFYLSKRAKKELALGEKFKQLEAKGPEAVDKFLAKKRAKNASKDKKSLPWARPPRSREED
jgi:hypothetical protein